MKWILEVFDFHVWRTTDNKSFIIFTLGLTVVSLLVGYTLKGFNSSILGFGVIKWLEFAALVLNIIGAVLLGKGLLIVPGQAFALSMSPTESPGKGSKYRTTNEHCDIEWEEANKNNKRIIDIKAQSANAFKGLTLITIGFLIQLLLIFVKP
ncbi:hypothetical protein [Pseudoalteromonas spongiae]|uniref:DUF3899 domain-containing protein n=1 Tax=Pseudoalteromonas spongiae TaxID=298657 RepID=A0ABU8EZ93_9GAMM